MPRENGSRNAGDNGRRTGAAGRQTGTGGVDPALFQSLEWRCIGPHRGGRVVAVAGDPVDPMTFYFGACAGGVWKTTDGGTYWECISDGYFNTAAVGALAVSASDPNVIYVGTGETAIRGNVSHGDGVYKSVDGGRTWRNMGLAETRHIAKVRIHPQNPDLVYVAALGDAWGPNPERGVYRSKDGGESWEQVLFRSERAGAIDLSMDPTNPRILYAAMWDAQRRPYALESGGPGSSIYRSTDGGDTWEELTNNPGLPTGVKGKIGIAAAPKPGRVYALVEAEDGALFCSDDGGRTWERRSDNDDLRRRAWYYMHLYADPTNPDVVWVLNLKCWRSIDGGRTFSQVPTPHGDDHDLWIDPKNPLRLIEGNDGGACVSFNGGASWSSIYNQPTAQFYHVIADNQTPYRVYGSQQDNSALTLPSLSTRGAITETEWYVPGGGESGYIAIRPDNPNIVYAGAIGSGPGHGRLIRYDHATGQQQNITVWPEIHGMAHGAKDLKYRFQWTYPIELSPHDPNVLYVAAQKVLRSTDEGMSWEEISPDLTRNDESKLQPSGGPITRDNTGAETYCTIFAFLESRHELGVFWAGTDDGLIHISRDAGKTWQNVTPKDLPEWALISVIEQSPHDPATVYVAATRYKLQDRTPYLYRTNDYGQSWTRITNGLPADDFTRTIREDPGRRGLLYAGTETGVYVSFDDGANWQSFQLNLPVCPIHDLYVKDGDLLAATHGRSFWILDDLSPLHQLRHEVANAEAYLAQPRPTIRWKVYRGYGSKEGPGKLFRMAGPVVVTFYATKKPTGERVERYLDAGQNPPDGVVVTYWLKERPEGEVTLTFRDGNGRVVRCFSSREATPVVPTTEPAEPAEGYEGGESMPAEAASELARDVRLTVEPGANRFVWNMRYGDAVAVEGDDTLKDLLPGPVVAPGTYTAELRVGGQVYTQTFEIRKDPRVPASQADLEAQTELLLRIRDKLSETHTAINALRKLRESVAAFEGRGGEVGPAARALKERLTGIEEALIQVKAQSALQFPPRLNAKLATLSHFVSSADTRPTANSYALFDDLSARIDQQLADLRSLLDVDLARFNDLVRTSGVPVVAAPSLRAGAGEAVPADN